MSDTYSYVILNKFGLLIVFCCDVEGNTQGMANLSTDCKRVEPTAAASKSLVVVD